MNTKWNQTAETHTKQQRWGKLFGWKIEKLTKKQKKNGKNEKKQSKKQKENEFIYEQAEFITNTALKCEMNNLEKTAKIHNARRIKMCKLFLNIQTVFSVGEIKLNSSSWVWFLCSPVFLLFVLLRHSSQRTKNKASKLFLFYWWNVVGIQFIVCQPHINTDTQNSRKNGTKKRRKTPKLKRYEEVCFKK